MVLTFDRQRELVPADRNVGFRCAETKQIKIAQPGQSLWSQAGQVGVLGSKTPTGSGERVQNLTLVGAPQACVGAGRRFEESLLNDQEMELGSRLWCAFRDPLQEGGIAHGFHHRDTESTEEIIHRFRRLRFKVG